MINVKRKINGDHFIFKDGVKIGYAWRYRAGRAFGLKLDGIYFNSSGPNRSWGATTKSYKRLRDAIADVENIIAAADKSC